MSFSMHAAGRGRKSSRANFKGLVRERLYLEDQHLVAEPMQEAMSAARERMISSVPIMLPPIVAIRSGTTVSACSPGRMSWAASTASRAWNLTGVALLVQDESGRIMRMPVFGPQDTSENDVTYRSDLRKVTSGLRPKGFPRGLGRLLISRVVWFSQSFPPAAVDLPRLQMMESEPSRTICANLSLPHDWSQASLESQDSKAEYYDLNW